VSECKPNPIGEPLGVLLVASQATAAALAAVPALDTAALLERAIIVERRCQARSGVLAALERRLAEIGDEARKGARKRRGRTS